ncbi:MAG: protein-glutamate O-methyltransferase CheR [Pseudomonadota bacterium]
MLSAEKIPITQEEFKLLRDYIADQSGIFVGDQKLYLIESRLTVLVIENGCRSFHEFYRKAANNPHNGLRDKIIDAITTNETLWFRDQTPWSILKEVIIPDFFNALSKRVKSKIRIWSAASSTGQEPYSIAMVLDEALRERPGRDIGPEHFEIFATDISPSALFLAMAGRYDQIAMSRGMNERFRDRYFTQRGRVWELDPVIRKRVTFKQMNLQTPFSPLGKFDLIMCRNVAIYFSDTFKRDLFSRMASTLDSRGYFFVGSAESLTGYSDDFELLEHKRGIYYRVKGR